ncbi:MAG: type II toxin-antitoxin system HipA family toxin [Lachnospiraceae bacterium]|nr:type II toxin-antitoxin system HipA family toxin [Lachnospiraceae bacterium]
MNPDNMKKRALSVFYGKQKVGTLASTANHLTAFEYDAGWLQNGFSISPLSLPLRKEVFVPKGYDPFEGTFGVFADSLPDGWGRLLTDRMLKKNGLEPASIDSLNRLAIIGASGMGALTYHPESPLTNGITEERSLDDLAQECTRILQSKEGGNLDELFEMGGSSGGARPKVYYQIDGEEWIVKFASSVDKADIGLQEYEYSLCAKNCGIQMAETRLLPSERCSGYFAVKRFDRLGQTGNTDSIPQRRQSHNDSLSQHILPSGIREETFPRRVHMISASALLETSHRIPNLDYHILMRLTLLLTNDYRQLEQLYRLMCFNVFAHNRDDHSKNFSYLYDKNEERWLLAPAYDLTYSNSIGGEHATTIDGNGRDPGIKELLAVAKAAKLDAGKSKRIAEDIREIVYADLEKWL